MADSRTKNVVRNFNSSIIKYIVQIVLKFVAQTAIIYLLGEQYVGIKGLFTNILGVLNLAELGIGNAIVFSMYKPIAENDTEKLKSLNNLFKKFYIIISVIVLCAGLITMPFLKFIIKDTPPDGINLYVVFVFYLLDTVISYFIAHKRSLLFAYQRNDIENKIKIPFLIGLNVTQIIVLFLTKNYYLYILSMPIFSLIEGLAVLKVAHKFLPEIRGPAKKLDDASKKEITKNITAMSFHKLGDTLVNSTDNIIISAIIGLGAVGIYNNYLLVSSSVMTFILMIVTSLRSSVGDYIATNSKENVYRTYKNYSFVFFWIATFCSTCLLCLFQDFILLWTKDSSYLISFTCVILMVVNFYLTTMRYPNEMFKNTAGLIWHDRWKPIIQGITNIVVSIILGRILGLTGILIGTVASTLIAPVWMPPLVLYHKMFNKSFSKYLLGRLTYLAICVLIATATYFLCSLLPFGFWWFVLKCFICLLVPNILMLIIYSRSDKLKFCFSTLKKVLARK